MISKLDTIQEIGLNPVPKYYDNMSDLPLQNILKHRDIYNSIYRFEKYANITFVVPEGGIGNVQYEHNLNKNIFVEGFVFTDNILETGGAWRRIPIYSAAFLTVKAAEFDDKYVYLEGSSLSPVGGDITVNIRLTFFSIKIR